MSAKKELAREVIDYTVNQAKKIFERTGKVPKGFERKGSVIRQKQVSPKGTPSSGSKEVAVRNPSQVARTPSPAEMKGVRRSGARRIAAGAGGVGAMSLFGGDKEKKKDTPAEKPTTTAKKKYNVGVSKGGVPFKEAFRHNRNKGAKTFTWNGKKYTTELDTEKAKRTASAKKPAAKKKVGGVRKFLFGADGKMGGKGKGEKGLLDNRLTRAFTKRDELNELRAEVAKKKPVKKAGGGMMKSKMASKGGARGGMKAGGLAMTMINGRKVPAFAADGKGAKDLAKKKNGGMMKSKGMAKGGAMKKKGYAMGGAVRSKMASKGGKRGGASRKPRGVGVAMRGYGKALK